MMTTVELIQWFLKNEPTIVKQMNECDHNFDSVNPNPYHSEGSIFTHTMMVMKEADRNNLQFEIKVAALLHDIGKPIVAERVEETKKVRFFNHDPVSAFMALDIMDKLVLNRLQKEFIFKLIVIHTEPFKIPLDKLQDDLKDYGLYYSLLKLSEADKNGRFHTQGNTQLYFNYSASPREIREYDKKVVLMVGLPCSGKSTYIKSLPEDEESFIISRDSILEANTNGSSYNDKWSKADQKDIDRLLQLAYKKSKDYKTVYVDLTHMSKKSRRKTISHFGKDWGKEVVVFLPSLTTIKKRAKLRTEKVISEEVINQMIQRFYPPVYGEGFDKIEYRMD